VSAQGRLTQCHSGTWYNAGQSGHGLQIEVLSENGSQQIVAVWYAFLDGGQCWLIAQGPINGANAMLTAVTTSGGQFPPNFNPAAVHTQAWGSLQLRAIDGDHLHLEWSSSISGFGSGGLDLERLTGVSGHSCP
jgi:hypothetical protein